MAIWIWRVITAILPHQSPTLLNVALYGAYGSNLDPEQMSRRTPHSPFRGTGWLEGWRLTFGGEEMGWDGALATVVESPEDPKNHVFVALYDLTAEDEKALDEWEGVTIGLYSKIRVRVHTLDGMPLCWVYVLNGYEGGLPSARYLGLMADAAEAAGAPDDYIYDLRNRSCISNG